MKTTKVETEKSAQMSASSQHTITNIILQARKYKQDRHGIIVLLFEANVEMWEHRPSPC